MAAGIVSVTTSRNNSIFASAKLADRGRVETARKISRTTTFRPSRPIEGPGYRGDRNQDLKREGARLLESSSTTQEERKTTTAAAALSNDERYLRDYVGGDSINSNNVGVRGAIETRPREDVTMNSDPESFRRHLSSQLTGCCTNYISYSAAQMCALYNQDCESGEQPSHDSGDQDCSQAGLSFIGISFSVNTAMGNPFSYQLCDQYPMENIIDRNYDYVMSMDEDGWLVGGGYKSFDYSGKMP